MLQQHRFGGESRLDHERRRRSPATASVVAAMLVLLVLLVRNAVGFSPPVATTTRRVVQQQQHYKPSGAPPQAGRLVSSSSCLYSLQPLLDGLTESSTPQTVFVGGKGGVGKTTCAAALAVELASSQEGQRVLVVSTDPAHSLGDALDETDLKNGRRQLTDPLTQGNLHALEVDAAQALEQFKDSLAAFDVDRLAQSLGVSKDLLESLGLAEVSGLLQSPPPGLDELVALVNVLNQEGQDYDVVVVDTAPTGHTLRLLALPQFLNGLLGKLIQLRLKLSGIASTLQAFLGSQQAEERRQAVDTALGRLEAFQSRMSQFQAQLQDASKTQFVVVTVPTQLGVAESKRLIAELQSQHVSVTNVIVNQCVGGAGGGGDEQDSGSEALQNYYNRRVLGQTKWIDKLQEAVDRVSNSAEYKENTQGNISLTKVPFFDVELVGIPALAYVGGQTYVDAPSFSELFDKKDSKKESQLVICGGKGGVGKTTTAASLAVSMAAQGHRVAIVSTDPAHSLGDALDINLQNGGKLVDCPLIGVPPSATGEVGSLSALEIDPSSALGQFKGVVDKLVGVDGSDDNEGVKKTFRELEQIFDTLPAGTDEVVALAQIVNLIQKQDFDRIVLDTAPTGHTLRMLSTPGFLADLIDRLLSIAQKLNSNSMVKMLINSKRTEELDATAAAAKSKILKFQLQLWDLEDLLANPDLAQFVIVTVATELATRESIRLLNDLTFGDPPVRVSNVVVNQVLNEDNESAASFLSHVASSQTRSMEQLEQSIKNDIRVTRARYLDTEPRGVFGLKAFANSELVVEDAVKQEAAT